MADDFTTSTKSMHLSIVSAEEELFSGDVKAVFVTGADGEMGIYPGHLQLLTKLKPGQVRFEKEDGTQDVVFASGGIVEVQPNVTTVLADTAMRAEDIDEMAAEEAKRRAEEILSDKSNNKTDYDKALIDIAEASAKLRAIKDLQQYVERN